MFGAHVSTVHRSRAAAQYERLRQKREEEEALEREREAEKRAKQLEEEKIKALKTKVGTRNNISLFCNRCRFFKSVVVF